jgi:prophage tail gpP-like protein
MSVASTPRIMVTLNGAAYTNLLSKRVVRDLREIAGSFEFSMLDIARNASVGGYGSDIAVIVPGMAAEISIDGELVLRGYVDEVRPFWHAAQRGITVTGRDRTGDLVDCAAAPTGPAEFNGLDLVAIATRICAPFNITARADVDVGAVFTRLAVATHETAMSMLEKAARQRALLVVSDGVGGLLLTHGGTTNAPAPINCGPGGNALVIADDSAGTFSWRKRFSDYYVKGQSERCAGQRSGGPAMDSTLVPYDGAPALPAAGKATARESAGVLMTGHASDPEVTRYRPTVRMTRTQSGMSTTQQQADWALRVAKGESENVVYGVLGFRAGTANVLWRPNQLTQVVDAYQGLDKPLLIDAVTYEESEKGQLTTLRLTGPSAYDLIDEAAKRRQRTGTKKLGPGDGSLAPDF